jgi:hypothetical protein
VFRLRRRKEESEHLARAHHCPFCLVLAFMDAGSGERGDATYLVKPVSIKLMKEMIEKFYSAVMQELYGNKLRSAC